MTARRILTIGIVALLVCSVGLAIFYAYRPHAPTPSIPSIAKAGSPGIAKEAEPERVSATTVQVPGIDEPDIVKPTASRFISPALDLRQDGAVSKRRRSE